MDLIVPRSVWEWPSQPVEGPARDISTVTHLVAHWPGWPVGVRKKLNTDALMAAFMRQLHAGYVTKGYAIAYNYVIPPQGRAWDGRGADLRDAAGGSSTWNARSISVMFALAQGEAVTPEQIGTAQLLHEHLSSLAGRQLQWEPHGRIRGATYPTLNADDRWGTACPGPAVWGEMRAGAFVRPDPPLPIVEPEPVEEEPMRLIQPWDDLVPDAAVFVQTGHLVTWLPTGDDVARVRALGATCEPGGAPWPVARQALKGYVLAGPTPRYADGTPGGRTVPSDFLAFA